MNFRKMQEIGLGCC